MLTSPEWTLVTELVQNHLVNTTAPREVLTSYFSAEFLAGVSLGAKARDNANALVTEVRHGGLRPPDPPLLRLLRALEKVVHNAPDLTRVQKMRDDAEHAVADEQKRLAAAGDPYDVTRLAGGEAFLDRRALRRALRTLVEDPAKLVLTVTGERSTGKSYSYGLISYLADAVQDFDPALVELDDTWTPAEVVERLALHIARDEDPPQPGPGDDGKKWNGYAALWLLTRAAATGRPWWFVLDGMNHLPPTSEVHDLVHELALGVLKYKQAHVRLVLLGYGGQLPFTLRRRHLSERVRPLDETDVREFLAPLITERQGAALDQARLDDQLNDAVGEVLEFARKASRANDGCFMRELGRAVEEFVDELAS